MQLLVRIVSVLLLVKMTMALASNATNVTTNPEAQDLLDVQANYVGAIAMGSRNSHFFCIERNTDFNAEGEASVTFTEFEQNSDYVWTLFFQLPALAYLDSERKMALLQIVVDTLNLPGTAQSPNTANPPQNLSDLCVGTFEFYELTTFRESILFHLYHRTSNLMASVISPQFEANVITAFQDSNNPYVVGYPEQPDVIAFNLSAMMALQQDEILLPFRVTEDNADPTVLAVYLGSFPSNVTLDEISIEDDMFAENPNPVNYGLEAGDIVFAVLGGILLVLLTALILLGYCIHPFWLA